MAVKIASLSVSRSDFGRMSMLYKELEHSNEFSLHLAVGAGHHNNDLGYSLAEVEDSGISLDYVISNKDGNEGVQAANVLAQTHEWLQRLDPSALLIVGDRFEMLAGAQAATLLNVPIIHVGGGHLTIGAIDDKIRHALTKLSSLHLVASKKCGERVKSLRENQNSIFITGAPEIDAILQTKKKSRRDFCNEVKLDQSQHFILVTFHPETSKNLIENQRFASEVERTLMEIDQQILITAPSADPGREPFLQLCRAVASKRHGVSFIPTLGFENFISAMAHAQAMLGNSSAGIIESATFGLPVVNVGDRQALRDRAKNVLDCQFNCKEIQKTLLQATSEEFCLACKMVKNPYGNGNFVKKTMQALRQTTWPIEIVKKWR